MPAGATEHPQEQGAGGLPVHRQLGGVRPLLPLHLGSNIPVRHPVFYLEQTITLTHWFDINLVDQQYTEEYFWK